MFFCSCYSECKNIHAATFFHSVRKTFTGSQGEWMNRTQWELLGAAWSHTIGNIHPVLLWYHWVNSIISDLYCGTIVNLLHQVCTQLYVLLRAETTSTSARILTEMSLNLHWNAFSLFPIRDPDTDHMLITSGISSWSEVSFISLDRMSE